ncbi:MAG: hypothetical protein IKX46_01455 [Verrucomicrobia bacterium]|nr:hypothetical protein [Verrucomicrobiota bacterium]
MKQLAGRFARLLPLLRKKDWEKPLGFSQTLLSQKECIFLKCCRLLADLCLPLLIETNGKKRTNMSCINPYNTLIQATSMPKPLVHIKKIIRFWQDFLVFWDVLLQGIVHELYEFFA